MVSVPLYFQVTANSSATVGGTHLLPAVVGNAVGGILAGALISKYRTIVSLITMLTSAGLVNINCSLPFR
jgi:formate/nitrite transporter FocA (FNT family)